MRCAWSQLSHTEDINILSNTEQQILTDFDFANVEIQADNLNVSMSAGNSGNPSYINVLELSGTKCRLEIGEGTGYAELKLDESKDSFLCTGTSG